ncbi:MAG: PEP-CTERM sorting domain-containing protein [Crocosphaera sp.]
MSVVTSTSEAQAATFDLTFTGVNTSITGTGTVTIDDSFLTPNLSSVEVKAATTAFQANLTNIPSSPTSTTFNLADLDELFLSTDASANVTGFTIFSTENGDGFVAFGSGPFLLEFFENGGSPVDQVVTGITPADEPATTPEPGTLLGLFAVGSMGVLTRKQKA